MPAGDAYWTIDRSRADPVASDVMLVYARFCLAEVLFVGLISSQKIVFLIHTVLFTTTQHPNGHQTS